MFFTFPEDARWNAERQAEEIGVEIGECRGVCSNAYCQSGPHPSGASKPIISSGPGSRASPNGNCTGGS
jgi:hypothetical protein